MRKSSRGELSRGYAFDGWHGGGYIACHTLFACQHPLAATHVADQARRQLADVFI